MRGFTIAQTMGTINLGLQNARKVPAIKKAIGLYGYDETRLQQGDSLFHEVERLRGNYDAKTFEAKQTHHSWKQKEKDAYSMYMDHLKLTRCALEDCPFLWNKMEMTGRRAYSFDGWTHQAKTLYSWILADETILKKLLYFNITPEKIKNGQQLVEEAIALRHAHIRLQTEAKHARVQWANGLKRLKQWYSAFRALLRIALEETPTQLKAVGIPVKLSARRSKIQPDEKATGKKMENPTDNSKPTTGHRVQRTFSIRRFLTPPLPLPTIRRRIERRLAVHQIENISDYVNYLTKTPVKWKPCLKTHHFQN